MPKLKIDLPMTGEDGNAFAILGRARKLMIKENLYDEHWKIFQLEACGGDYDHLVQTCQKWFNTT